MGVFFSSVPTGRLAQYDTYVYKQWQSRAWLQTKLLFLVTD